jgi:hypothetical protein
MDEWLDRIEADKSGASLQQKVVRNRPPRVKDACWVAGQRVDDFTTCRQLYPSYGQPRNAAGEGMAANTLKCRLKALRQLDYNVQFSAEEWTRLKRAFPSGVCDWTRPGEAQQRSVPWMTYAHGPGGSPLGPAPRAQRFRSA